MRYYIKNRIIDGNDTIGYQVICESGKMMSLRTEDIKKIALDGLVVNARWVDNGLSGVGTDLRTLPRIDIKDLAKATKADNSSKPTETAKTVEDKSSDKVTILKPIEYAELIKKFRDCSDLKQVIFIANISDKAGYSFIRIKGEYMIVSNVNLLNCCKEIVENIRVSFNKEFRFKPMKSGKVVANADGQVKYVTYKDIVTSNIYNTKAKYILYGVVDGFDLFTNQSEGIKSYSILVLKTPDEKPELFMRDGKRIKELVRSGQFSTKNPNDLFILTTDNDIIYTGDSGSTIGSYNIYTPVGKIHRTKVNNYITDAFLADLFKCNITEIPSIKAYGQKLAVMGKHNYFEFDNYFMIDNSNLGVLMALKFEDTDKPSIHLPSFINTLIIGLNRSIDTLSITGGNGVDDPKSLLAWADNLYTRDGYDVWEFRALVSKWSSISNLDLSGMNLNDKFKESKKSISGYGVHKIIFGNNFDYIIPSRPQEYEYFNNKLDNMIAGLDEINIEPLFNDGHQVISQVADTDCVFTLAAGIKDEYDNIHGFYTLYMTPDDDDSNESIYGLKRTEEEKYINRYKYAKFNKALFVSMADMNYLLNKGKVLHKLDNKSVSFYNNDKHFSDNKQQLNIPYIKLKDLRNGCLTRQNRDFDLLQNIEFDEAKFKAISSGDRRYHIISRDTADKGTEVTVIKDGNREVYINFEYLKKLVKHGCLSPIHIKDIDELCEPIVDSITGNVYLIKLGNYFCEAPYDPYLQPYDMLY